MRKKLLHIVFALLMVGTFLAGGLWYYFHSLQWQNDDPPIGYIVGAFHLCYFCFFMLVGEGVLWRNTVYFSSEKHPATREKFARILLILLSFAELTGAGYALFGADTISLALNDFLAVAMLLISGLQILCQAMIRFRKRHTASELKTQ